MSTKPGRDEQAVGVDRRGRADPSTCADLGDDAVVDRDVGRARRGAGAVDDGAAADDQVVRAHADAPSRSAGSSSPVSSWSEVRRVLAVGAEARAGDDEPLDAERGELAQPLGADVGRPDDREAVDELGRRAPRCARPWLLQVLVAVVAAADLGDDRAIGLGRARRRSSPGIDEKWANAATRAADQRRGPRRGRDGSRR